MVSRELSITTDPYAYDEDEIARAITTGYATASDLIAYASSLTPTFKTLRVTTFSDAVNRDVIIEEAIDQVAAASIFGGTYGASGSFECAFRGWDFATNGLLEGILGAQTETPTTSPGSIGGYRYELAQVPMPLAIKIVDEQATDTTGSNNVSGATIVYRGVGITTCDINLNVKEYSKCTINWIARRAEVFDAGYNTSSTITGDPAIFYNAVLKWTPDGGSAETMKCKGFTMTLNRTMDQDYFFIGSEFLQGLYYNGLTDLGGQITLGAGDWQRIRTTIAGATTGGDATLDVGNTEFTGTVAGGTVLANAIPSGEFEVLLHTPDGTRETARFICNTAKLTEMSHSVQGRNQFEKTVSWKAQINATDKFYIDVFAPAA
jgi:hypothetical protein